MERHEKQELDRIKHILREVCEYATELDRYWLTTKDRLDAVWARVDSLERSSRDNA